MTLSVCASCGAPVDATHIYNGGVTQPKYEEKTLSELFRAWIDNWKVVQTGIREIVGDSQLPDPREMAEALINMPEEVWVEMFRSETATEILRKQMDLQKLMAEVQLENAHILNAALQREN